MSPKSVCRVRRLKAGGSGSTPGNAIDWVFQHSAGSDAHPDGIAQRIRWDGMAYALARVAAEGEAVRLDAELFNHLRPGLLARSQELAVLS